MQLLFDLSLVFGLLVPVLLLVGYQQSFLTRLHLELFMLGTALGLVWEFGFHLADMHVVTAPIFSIHVSVPVPWFVQAVSYSLWDGLLFLVGLWLIQALQSGPAFSRFRWRELGILVLWGQFQSLVVELSAILGGLWTYHTAWWNPGLFAVGDGTITVLPQLIWLVAMGVFYGTCLRIRQ